MIDVTAITNILANATKNEARLEAIRKAYGVAQNAMADLAELLSDDYTPAEKPVKEKYVRPAKRRELAALAASDAIAGTVSKTIKEKKVAQPAAPVE